MRGDGRIFQRGGSWWIQFQAQGQQHREPARIVTDDGIERPARTDVEARRALKARRRDVLSGRIVGRPDRVTVGELLDDYERHRENRGIKSLRTLKAHIKPVRAFFGTWRAVEVTSAAIERYQRERLAAGRARATVNRELEALGAAYRTAAKVTPPKVDVRHIPSVPRLAEQNARTGFFTQAEVLALLAQLPAHYADPTEWAFRTGMRRGELVRLTWQMLDVSAEPWVLRIPATITKNSTPRSFGFDGEARAIIERRIAARRMDCPLIFHRGGQPIGQFWEPWRAALSAAGLPAGRLFHDLRRSAVRNLIRSGVDQVTAMKVSGHVTDSMFRRYNITTEAETAAALKATDAYLATQPKTRNVVRMAAAGGGPPAQPFGDSSGTDRAVTADESMVPEVGIEPTRGGASRDFESRASANFATPAAGTAV
jgi:integrase